MYILIISRGYPTEKYKTNGLFEFDQARALASQGCKVVYAAIDLRSIRRWRKWGIRKKRKDGVDIYSINIPVGGLPINLLARISTMGLKILYKHINKEQGKPDLMHAHFTNAAYTASILKDETNIPLVVTEHSSQINKDNIDKDLYKMAKIAYSKADSLIAVSPHLANMINKKFSIQPIYIPNMVNLDIFIYEEKIGSHTFNFVSTGNLIDLKRMDLTIEAFYQAFGNNPKVTLTIFGQGPKKEMLNDLIDKYKLESQVKLMGLSSREEIADQYKKSHCFVLASQSETFGLAYVEALAMGLPVIATRCGGPEGFVNDKNGLMVDINNPQQLSQAMGHMYNNIDNYNGKNISKETKEKFSPQTIANKLIDIYKKLG